MNVASFTAKAQSLLSADTAVLARNAEKAAFAASTPEARLAEKSRQIDELIDCGTQLKDQLVARGRLLDEFEKVSLGSQMPPRSRPTTPLNPILDKPSEPDDVVEILDRVYQGPDAFDAESDRLMAGVNVLDPHNLEAAIERLRAASSYWSQDLLAHQKATLEQSLRSARYTNAEAAAMLGQPIATANVPVSVARRGAIEVSQLHLVPSRIASPPAGFCFEDDAIQKSLDLVKQTPGITIIGTQDSSRGYFHLAEVQTDTSPRTLSSARRFGRASKTFTTPVEIAVNDSKVWFVRLTDGSLYRQTDLKRTPWPDGFSTPMTLDELSANGVSSPFKSLLTMTKEAGKTNFEAAESVEEALVDLARVRVGIRNQKVDLAATTGMLDKPGRGSPELWEVEPIVRSDDGNTTLPALNPESRRFSQPLQNVSVREGVMHATQTKPPRGAVATAVMQDSDGTPHLVYLDNITLPGTGDQNTTYHHDLRALIDHRDGQVWLRESDDIGRITTISSAKANPKVALNIESIFRELFEGKTYSQVRDKYFMRFAEDEAIRVLDTSDYNLAAQRAFNISSKRYARKEDAMLLVVKIGKNIDGSDQLGIVGRTAPKKPSVWTSDIGWAEKGNSRLVALVDHKKVAWVRPMLRTTPG